MADSSSSDEKTAVIQGDPETIRKEVEKAKEQPACLIMIRGKPQGHRYFLNQNEMVLGRDASADIVINDQSVSRKHARIFQQGAMMCVTDLGSSNGTLVNDRKVEPNETRTLAKEDMIKLGNVILKFLPAGQLETIYYGNLGDAANLDGLTKIFNKAYLLEALDVEFKRAKALHTDFSVLFFDLDHFKKINDTFGHDAGDFVLKEFTQLVRVHFLRPKDVFGRYGGEEFVVLLGNTAAAKAAEIAEKIRAAVHAHAFMYEGKRMPVTTSLGVAELNASMESPQTLLKDADKALYSAKQTGRNKVVVAS